VETLRDQPYLSVVVTARNDDHGGNLLGRLQAFVNAWLSQTKRYGLSSELLVVDWNPPADRPPLVEALQWPAETGPCQVRFIQVPPENHETYENHKSLPLYQYIAKNVGIRRSRGKFILATNIDIIFSDELFRFLSKRQLLPGRMYRIDRWDVLPDVPVFGTAAEQLRYCERHLIRVWSREGCFDVSQASLRLMAENDIATPSSGISLGEGWFPREASSGDGIFRWAAQDAEVVFKPPSEPPPPLVLELEAGPGVDHKEFTLEFHNPAGRILAQTVVPRWARLELILPAGDGWRSFRLHVRSGGRAPGIDLRVQNYRVFRFYWDCDRPRPDTQAPGQFVVRFLQQPVVTTVQRWKHFYTDSGGVLGTVYSALAYYYRSKRFLAKARRGEDIFERGSGIYAGAGWLGPEHFKGETFRWVAGQGELIVRSPAEPPSHIAVQIEAGPGVAFKPFELLVRDHAGAVAATVPVGKLGYVEIPLPLQPGRTQVFSLAAKGGGTPTPGGDSRILDFRLFWCGWPIGTKPTPHPVDLPGYPEVPMARGVEFGQGWDNPRHSETRLFRAGRSGAEIIVRPRETREDGFYIEIEATPEGERLDLEIRNEAGHILTSARMEGRQFIHVASPFRPERTSVLQLVVPDAPPNTAVARVWMLEWAAGPLCAPVLETRPRAAHRHPVLLHTYACGDFTLMAREHWLDLRGYPEFDMYSLHIDSLFCYAAHYGGAPEEMLHDPMRIYHIEHGLGSGWTPEGAAVVTSRLRTRNIPNIHYSELMVWVDTMRRLHSPMIFNREHWGLVNHQLQEIQLQTTFPAPADAPPAVANSGCAG